MHMLAPPAVLAATCHQGSGEQGRTHGHPKGLNAQAATCCCMTYCLRIPEPGTLSLSACDMITGRRRRRSRFTLLLLMGDPLLDCLLHSQALLEKELILEEVTALSDKLRSQVGFFSERGGGVG